MVAEARKAHRVAAIHRGRAGRAPDGGIRAGADTIEHCNQLTRELAEKMARNGIFMVPTLAWFFQRGRSGTGPTFNAEYVRKGRMMAEASARSIVLAKTAGVRIAAGTEKAPARRWCPQLGAPRDRTAGAPGPDAA